MTDLPPPPERISFAVAQLLAERDAVVARDPWPLSAHYGAEPESDWGPREVLAHCAEMIPFWMREAERIIAQPAGLAEPPPFGRVATDENRIARIGEDRRLPADELFDRIAASAADAARRLAELDADALARTGTHTRLGAMTVEALVERFVSAHLVDHAAQLRDILDRDVGTDRDAVEPTHDPS